jgi:cysteine-rich repeat protein
VIEGPETCDDGNTVSGDGCSNVCLVEPSTAVCGDGVIEGAEECDDGASTDPGYARCGFDCRFGGYCGDGIVNGGETCDVGGDYNNAQYGNPAGCTSGCQIAGYCGDAVVDTDEGEQCDLGLDNGMVSSPCTRDCKIILF